MVHIYKLMLENSHNYIDKFYNDFLIHKLHKQKTKKHPCGEVLFQLTIKSSYEKKIWPVNI